MMIIDDENDDRNDENDEENDVEKDDDDSVDDNAHTKGLGFFWCVADNHIHMRDL